MHACVCFSSRTGNTRMLAEALSKAFSLPLFALPNLPDADRFDTVFAGFWVKRGLPDESALDYLKTLQGKQVFYFCTHAAWPDSEHMRACNEAVTKLLEAGSNRILGHFTCQGRVSGGKEGVHHPMTAERRARLDEAARHPNDDDIRAFLAMCKGFFV